MDITIMGLDLMTFGFLRLILFFLKLRIAFFLSRILKIIRQIGIQTNTAITAETLLPRHRKHKRIDRVNAHINSMAMVLSIPKSLGLRCRVLYIL